MIDKKKEELQQRYYQLAVSQINLNTPLLWKLSDKQTDKLNDRAIKLLEDISDTSYEESTVFRLMAKTLRIGTILSSVRSFENGELGEINPESTEALTIDDASFEAAWMIVKTSFEHTCALQSMLDKGSRRKPMQARKDWRDQFIDQLPETFKYNEGLQLCREYGKQKDSWKKALRYWQEKGLLAKREQDGAWVKLHPAPEADASKQP